MALQVTDVKLPARTRARIGEQTDAQRVQRPHDIRGSIPLVDYTNPSKFPMYVFREYPKMPLLDNNKPIVIDETGSILLFYDAEDETEFLEMNPEVADEILRNAPATLANSALAAAQDEVESLRRKLQEAGIDPDAGKARRTSVPATKVSGLTKGTFVPPADEPAPVAAAPVEEESELRKQIKQAAAEQTVDASNPGKASSNPLRQKKK